MTKNGSLTIHVDYLHDTSQRPMLGEDEIKTLLGDGYVKYEGQAQSVEVAIKSVQLSSDYFWSVSDEFYE